MPSVPNISVSIENRTNRDIRCIISYNRMRRWRFYSSYYRIIEYTDNGGRARSKIVYDFRNSILLNPNSEEDIFCFTTSWGEDLESISLYMHIINLIIANITIKDMNNTILSVINNFDVSNIMIERVNGLPLNYHVIIGLLGNPADGRGVH